MHQGSVLSPLLFILVLEALSRHFLTGVPYGTGATELPAKDALMKNLLLYILFKKVPEQSGNNYDTIYYIYLFWKFPQTSQ